MVNKKRIIMLFSLLLIIGTLFATRDKIAFQLSLNKAYYYENKGNKKAAVKEYDSLIEKEPRVYELYVNKAIILAEMNNYDEALETFKEAENLNANDSELYYNMAHLYRLMGNVELEENCIEKAASIDFEEDNKGRD